jgi:Na+-driven multidrug efflux pump
MTRRQDLLFQAPLLRAIPLLGWPVLITGQVFVLYQLIYTFWMGRLLGEVGLTILAVMNPVTQIASWLLEMVIGGHTSLVARSVGARDGQGMRLLANATVLIGLVGGLLASGTLLLRRPLAHLIGGAEIAPALESYLVPFCFSFPVMGLCRVLVETVVATGRTTFGLVRELMNILFIAGISPLLIYALGAPGAPTAVLISEALLSVTIWLLLRKRGRELGLGERDRGRPLIDVELWIKVFDIGAPIQAARMAGFFAMLLLVRFAMHEGKAAAAGLGLGMSLSLFPLLISMAVSRTCAILVGQNMGARNSERALSAVRYSVVMAVGVVFGLVLLVPFARPVVGLFSSDQAVVDAAMRALGILRWGFAAVALAQVLEAGYIAAGRSTLAGILMLATYPVGLALTYTRAGSPLEAAAWGYSCWCILRALADVLLVRRSLVGPVRAAAAAAPPAVAA